MSINLGVPDDIEPQMKPRITVVGVGGAGGNAVNNMIEAGLEGVDFVVANTDAQALAQARTDRRIQLGAETTHGLGSGARPDIGRAAAEESYEAIAAEMKGSHMCFITAGMGGGTGTGAAPVAARCARDMGILTVGVVTKPFQFEGSHRMRLAEGGIDELSQYVDTLIIIPNQNLFRVANEKTTFADAFKMADNVLYAGVRSVTDLMIMPGLINLDFADVRTVMMDMGRAMMGTGEASGDNRAIEAAEAAIANPLLEETSMRGARGVLINITGGNDLTLYELDEAANRIREEIKCEDANVIFGSCLDATLEGVMRVSVVASGIDALGYARSQDSQETSTGSGFGLGLAAAGRATTGAARHPTAARSVRGQAVLDDTAADLKRGDDLVDPAAVLDTPSTEPRESPRTGVASADTPQSGRIGAAPAGPETATGQARSQGRGPGQGAHGTGALARPRATGDAPFVPTRPPQQVASVSGGASGGLAGISATVRAPAAAPTGARPSVASDGAATGHAEPVPPVRGQTALDPRYHDSEARAGGPEGGRRLAAQPGLHVTAPPRDAMYGGSRDRQTGAERDHRDDDRRERPSLFQRMTGFGRIRSGEDEREAGHGHGQAHGMARRPAGLREPAGAERRAGARGEDSRPRAMTVNPEDRPVSSAEDEQLEIPAFLRRQAN